MNSPSRLLLHMHLLSLHLPLQPADTTTLSLQPVSPSIQLLLQKHSQLVTGAPRVLLH